VKKPLISFVALSLWLIIFQAFACGQGTSPEAVRIDQAVDQALSNYPAIRTARAQKAAADAGLIRTHGLPARGCSGRRTVRRATTSSARCSAVDDPVDLGAGVGHDGF
jgi:hypothetical protein